MTAKNNGKAKWIGLLVTVMLIFGSIVGTWTVYGKDIGINKDDIKELEIEGCKPAIVNKFDVAIAQKDIETIQQSLVDIRTEQTAGFDEILSRLPK